MAAKAASALKEALPRLEKAYGRLLPASDPVEGGAMALLALHAPSFSTEEARDRVRTAFVDWNEVRVADPWDVTTALDASGSAEARAFARALLRYLESLHTVLNRCSFDVPAGETAPDWEASLSKMRGATPGVRAVCLAMVSGDDAWVASADVVKAAVKLGLSGKTTSGAKVGAALAELAAPADRLRVLYLLGSWGGRSKDAPDPLAPPEKPAKAAKSAKTAKSAKAAKASSSRRPKSPRSGA